LRLQAPLLRMLPADALRARLAAASVPADAEAAAALCSGLDASCRVPRADAPAEAVLATLDLNRGATLPAEELIGTLGAASARAYLSNVAVAPGARRRGAAAALVAAAASSARAAGVTQLYVHCVCDNGAALALYERAGFAVECAESAADAHARSHPRRLLLTRTL
jgi:ribosomal protein S18 acetylase RimI-like enzyme